MDRSATRKPSGSVLKTNQLSFLTGARSLGAAVTARELLDPTRRIDEFLFAGEKRMASGTDADFNVTTCRAGVIHGTARAHNIGLKILWMNVRFHLQKGAQNLTGSVDSRKG
jgi:hypothetical protein